jgi:hypothetical protein
MKKLKLFTVAFLIGMTSLFASDKNDNPNNEIRVQIIELLDYEKLVGEFGEVRNFTVNFSFTFNSKGEIIVLSVDSNREDIKDYIRKTINYKKLQNPGIKNEIYKMPINVKIIS